MKTPKLLKFRIRAIDIKLLLLICVGLSGCETTKPQQHADLIVLRMAYKGREIEVPVEPSNNEHCRKGVRFFASQD